MRVVTVSASGFAAGLIATRVLGLFEPLERELLAREQLYAPGAIAERLFGRRQLGDMLRLAYGGAIGAVYAVARQWLPSAGPVRALALGAGIAGFELVVLPATGATPRLAGWPRADVGLLLPHALAFAAGLVAVAELLALARR